MLYSALFLIYWLGMKCGFCSFWFTHLCPVLVTFFFTFLVAGSGEFSLCVFSTLKDILLLGCVFSPLIFPIFLKKFYSPLLLCVLKVPFKINSSTLQNHQPPFFIAIGGCVNWSLCAHVQWTYVRDKASSTVIFFWLIEHSLGIVSVLIEHKTNS